MRYVSREIRPGQDGRGQVVGDLTLRGVTRPVTLDVVLNGYGRDALLRPTVGFSASGAISRRAFGVTAFQNIVGDQITLQIEAEFHPR
jgi:polyisoprenoid-binding protein YceI